MLMIQSGKIFINISRLLFIVSLSIVAHSGGAAEDRLVAVGATDSSEQLAAYEKSIEDLEFEFGPYHPSLLEPLQSMIELVSADEDYERVAQLQERQLQVMRTELGFEHPDLIPVLQSIMTTQLALGNWEEISDHLEHIRHLRSSIDGENAEPMLGAIQDQIDWLFSRITIEERREQVRNFFQIRDLYEEMEDLVNDAYGKDSIEAAPWLYKIAYNDYHLVRFLNGSRGLGSESIDRLVRREGTFGLERQNRNSFRTGISYGVSSFTPVVERGNAVGVGYLRDGYSMVGKIQDVIEETDDLEAQAMMKIYRSDFQRLADRGRGIRGYIEAQELLLEAGMDEGDVRWFFERPAVIPMQNLHLNFADALAELREPIEPVAPVEQDEMHLGVFTAWIEALDSTPMPRPENPFWQLDYPFQFADISFTVNSSGSASSVDILATGPEEWESKRSVWRSVRDIHFRPAIIDKKARRVRDVRMRYQFVDE